MSQGFKINLGDLRNNVPNDQELPAPEITAILDRYDTIGYARNLCVVWLDGRRMFFNYAYLISAEFQAPNEQNEISLNFSGYQVALKGYALNKLFADLHDQVTRVVFQVDVRYAETEEENTPMIVEILVSKDE
jgi:hypothetical protein